MSGDVVAFPSLHTLMRLSFFKQVKFIEIFNFQAEAQRQQMAKIRNGRL